VFPRVCFTLVVNYGNYQREKTVTFNEETSSQDHNTTMTPKHRTIAFAVMAALLSVYIPDLLPAEKTLEQPN
jgi:hypothetical protein